MENVTRYAFIEQDRPILKASVVGDKSHPEISGEVYVYILDNGFYIQGDFSGLPKSSDFAFHIHEGLLCEEPGEKKLILPDLMSDAEGRGSIQVYLDRIDVNTLADHPIVIHLKADGQEIEIACGLLKRIL